MMKKLLSVLMVALVGTMVMAQEPAKISGELGFDIHTAYFRNGIMQENQGVIAQPYLNLSYRLWDNKEKDAVVKNVRVVGSWWNSLHSEDDFWYESDMSIGLRSDVGKFTFGFDYVNELSPANNFGTVNELDFTVMYNDKEIWKNTILNQLPNFSGFRPYALFGLEVGDNGRGGAGPGEYFEIGVKPEITFTNAICGKPLTVGFPVRTTWGFDDYYGVDSGNEWGYLGFGPTLSIPLTPSLTFNTSLDVLILGDGAETFAPNGDSPQYVGKIGLVWKF